MQLDIQLIKRILEDVSSGSGNEQDLIFKYEYGNTSEEGRKVAYHLVQLKQAGFIKGRDVIIPTEGLPIDYILAEDLTWNGHQLLQGLQKSEVVDGIKEFIGGSSSTARDVLITTGVTAGITNWKTILNALLSAFGYSPLF